MCICVDNALCDHQEWEHESELLYAHKMSSAIESEGSNSEKLKLMKGVEAEVTQFYSDKNGFDNTPVMILSLKNKMCQMMLTLATTEDEFDAKLNKIKARTRLARVMIPPCVLQPCLAITGILTPFLAGQAHGSAAQECTPVQPQRRAGRPQCPVEGLFEHVCLCRKLML